MAIELEKTADDIREAVRQECAKAATSMSCCATACCVGDEGDAGFGARPVDHGERELLPEGAALASLGCGSPTAVAELHEGEVVLDLRSGGGIDVLLSAHRVGPHGKAYGARSEAAATRR